MTPSPRLGATVAEWTHFSLVLGLTQDLLPVAADPDARISPDSTLKSIGKTPSRFNAAGDVVGIAKWTSIHATDHQVDLWSRHGKLSCCVQTRSVRAIDIDVDDTGLAARIRARVVQLLGVSLPARARPGAPRVVLACTVDAATRKRVVRLAGAGVVELLADGQQFVVAGTHIKDGRATGRYFWEGGLPAAFPVVEPARLAAVLDAIEAEFGEQVQGVLVRRPSEAGGVAGAADRPGSAAPSAGAGELADRLSADGVPDWLERRGWVRGTGRGGELQLWCPWEAEHTSDSGETETVYWPAGTGGYLAGHFKCLHAHCAKRTDAEFLDAVGWSMSMVNELEEIGDDAHLFRAGRRTGRVPGGDADRGAGGGDDRRGDGGPGGARAPAGGSGPGRAGVDAHADGRAAASPTPRLAGSPLLLAGVAAALPVAAALLPEDPTAAWGANVVGKSLKRGRAGWLPTPENVGRAFETLGWWRRLGHDMFRDAIMWTDWADGPGGEGSGEWREWSDNDYTLAQRALENEGFAAPARDVVKNAVREAALRCKFDAAQLWLSKINWDGHYRVNTFLSRLCGAPVSLYSEAVSRYLWTALAGRVADPGCKLDMVPVLIAEGGAGKTTAVHALAPVRDFAVRVNLQDDDEKNARKLRGRLVAEIAELRGVGSRDAESIKDFLSAQSDRWTPKYLEFATEVQRRCLFVGTTDNPEFLTDPVGNFRRWLPVRVCVSGGQIDVRGIEAECAQLWAEGLVQFAKGGVAWADAERLARLEHGEFVLEDDWSGLIEAWASRVADDGSAGPADLDSHAATRTWADVGFTSAQCLAGLGLGTGAINSGASRRLAGALRALGYERGRGKTSEGTRNRRTWTLKRA